MNSKALFLFLILLFGLILCSFLGSNQIEGFTTNTYSGPRGGEAASVTTNQGNTYAAGQGPRGNTGTASNVNGTINSSNTNYDNYNHYTGASYPTMFYGPDGGSARVIQTSNDNYIVITYKNGTTEMYYINNDDTSNNNNVDVETYYGPNGASAKIVTDNNGKQAVEITGPNGSSVLYTEDNTYVYNSQDGTLNDNTDVDQYYGPNGGQATTITGPGGNTAGVVTGPGGNTYAGTTNNNGYYNNYKNGYYNNGADVNQYYGPNGGQATTVTGPGGNTAGVVTGPGGNTYVGTSNNNDYYNSLPPGINRNQIPPGQEDLYILKSEVVPPVCPACPIPVCPDTFDEKKCQPCPPCSRCPEPAFDCKKVPNYKAFNQDYLPVPVLNDFSSFGM